jgi:hypothetical protein
MKVISSFDYNSKMVMILSETEKQYTAKCPKNVTNLSHSNYPFQCLLAFTDTIF